MTKRYFPICRVLLPVLLLFFVSAAWAQVVTIRGTVRDAAGQPLSGASIVVEGSSKGTVADANGTYALSVTPGP